MYAKRQVTSICEAITAQHEKGWIAAIFVLPSYYCQGQRYVKFMCRLILGASKERKTSNTLFDSSLDHARASIPDHSKQLSSSLHA